MKIKKIIVVSLLIMTLTLLSACSKDTDTVLSEAESKISDLETQISSQSESLNELQLENTALKDTVHALNLTLSELQEEVNIPVPSPLLLQAAIDVMNAIQAQDMTTLSNLTHPTDGLTFSPYVYVDVQNSLLFAATDLPNLLSDTTLYTWGNYDGSGDSITLAFSDYYSTFIYDHDYLTPHTMGINQLIGSGNTINNLDTAFPGASYVEFHFTGFDPQYEGMDWSSLILIFKQENGMWYLTGIAHNQWTI